MEETKMKILGINLIILLLTISQPSTALNNGDNVIIDTEESVLIEDWMLEELIPCQESEWILEGWMFVPLFPEAEEEEIKLEEWMFE